MGSLKEMIELVYRDPTYLPLPLDNQPVERGWERGTQHIVYIKCYNCYWGEHERAPPRQLRCEFSIYIFLSFYRTSCRKSLPALIWRILTSCVNSKMIHMHAWCEYSTCSMDDGDNTDGDHWWTYLFTG